MALSGYGKAQISIENSADDKVEIKKVTPKTDGSTNIYFPTDISRDDYDTSLDAQIEYYKAFIGQRILFYAGAIGFQPIKPHAIELPKPLTWAFETEPNFVGKSKKFSCTIRYLYTRQNSYKGDYNMIQRRYGVEGYFSPRDKSQEETYNKQFFTLVNVLTPWEADQILDDNSMHPAELPLDMQKKLQKIKKKMEGKRDWDELQSLSHLFITQTDDGETVFSQTVNHRIHKFMHGCVQIKEILIEGTETSLRITLDGIGHTLRSLDKKTEFFVHLSSHGSVGHFIESAEKRPIDTNGTQNRVLAIRCQSPFG